MHEIRDLRLIKKTADAVWYRLFYEIWPMNTKRCMGQNWFLIVCYFIENGVIVLAIERLHALNNDLIGSDRF